MRRTSATAKPVKPVTTYEDRTKDARDRVARARALAKDAHATAHARMIEELAVATLRDARTAANEAAADRDLWVIVTVLPPGGDAAIRVSMVGDVWAAEVGFPIGTPLTAMRAKLARARDARVY